MADRLDYINDRLDKIENRLHEIQCTLSKLEGFLIYQEYSTIMNEATFKDGLNKLITERSELAKNLSKR
jgi:deferrochelatase/peroxidase EfeB